MMNLASLFLSERDVIRVSVNIGFWFSETNCFSSALSDLSRMNDLQISLYICIQQKEFGLKPNCFSILTAGPFTALPWISGLIASTFLLFFWMIDLNPGISSIGFMLTNGFEGAMIISSAFKSAIFASFVIFADLIPLYFSFMIFGEHRFLTKYSWNDIQPDLVCTSVRTLSSVG